MKSEFKPQCFKLLEKKNPPTFPESVATSKYSPSPPGGGVCLDPERYWGMIVYANMETTCVSPDGPCNPVNSDTEDEDDVRVAVFTTNRSGDPAVSLSPEEKSSTTWYELCGFYIMGMALALASRQLLCIFNNEAKVLHKHHRSVRTHTSLTL